ncbi:putative hydrolase [Cladobotryum mycophilum]|uniref:Hydrolase n=1 Tax=Cladobotryum mycophilum TaxID=491253 RepID=A0ABR0S5N9_9HYPO
MRTVLGIPKSDAIRAIESTAMTAQTPQPGLTKLMSYLDSRGIRKAILTRNFDVPVQHLLTKFLSNFVFHPVITRDFRPPKPHPAGILHIAQNWGLKDGGGATDARGLIMVGDSIDDMTAGRLAGAATVLLLNDVNQDLAHHENTDLVIRQLDELVDILDQGFQGREIESEGVVL